MKIVRHLHPFLLLLVFSLALAPAGWAQTPTEDAVQTQEAAPPAPTPPAEPEKQEAPAAPTAEATPPQADEEGMRELGNADEPEAKAAEHEKRPEKQDHDWRHGARERVSIGGNSTLEEDEYAAEVVSILGSSTSAGHVRGAVVSILGGSRVTGGTVGDNVVSVFGNTYVNGEVKGEVVAVLGNVELGPKAVVRGDVVCIAGQFKRAPGAVFRGEVHNVAFAGGRFDFGKLGAWFSECLVQGRLLAFDSRLIWAWTIALAALGLYALIALIAPSGVNRCVETLEERPGSSLLAALLTMLLTPVAYILLALTLAIAIGVILIPLFSLGLFFASVFGKIVMLAWLGRRFTRLMGDGPAAHPVFGVLIGGVVVLLLYATPYVGIVVYKLLGVLGLGVVVYTIIRHTKANRPPRPPVTVPAGVASVTPAPIPAPVVGDVPPQMAAPVESPAMVPPLVSAAPVVISAATLFRAGFWIRVAAALLDTILVGIVFGMLNSMFGAFVKFGGSFPLWFVVYNIVMWGTKATTIGGIICGLKVVRLDDRPLDWSVAIVRALGAFLSLAVAGLGFIWVAFDDERQSWHDKIAGTTIVKVPKGTPLL